MARILWRTEWCYVFSWDSETCVGTDGEKTVVWLTKWKHRHSANV